MTVDWRQAANRRAAVARIADIHKYVTPRITGDSAPIDGFYGTVGTILRAADPALLTSNPLIGALMLVGWVSATENYFRDTLTGIIKLCPCAHG